MEPAVTQRLARDRRTFPSAGLNAATPLQSVCLPGPRCVYGRIRASRDKVLRSRANGCAAYGSPRRSLRMTAAVVSRFITDSEGGAPLVLSGCIRACAPTEESAGWAHGPVGYAGFGARNRPFPKKILRSAPWDLRVEDGLARRLPQNDTCFRAECFCGFGMKPKWRSSQETRSPSVPLAVLCPSVPP